VGILEAALSKTANEVEG